MLRRAADGAALAQIQESGCLAWNERGKHAEKIVRCKYRFSFCFAERSLVAPRVNSSVPAGDAPRRSLNLADYKKRRGLI